MASRTTKSVTPSGRVMITRIATIEEQGDRSFDVDFWQRLSSEQRATAVWELAVNAWQSKGKTSDELRLQRSIETLRRGGR